MIDNCTSCTLSKWYMPQKILVHYRNETLHMHNQDKKQINELRKFIISSIILMSQFA